MADVETTSAASDPSESTSLADHEAQFGGGAGTRALSQSVSPAAEGGPALAPETEPETPPAELEPSAPDRDASGKFVRSNRQVKSDAQKRIDELTRNWRQAERERDEWRARASTPPPVAQSEPAVQTPQPAQPQTTPKPKEEDFERYGDYVDALADWKIAEARKQDRAEAAAAQQRTQQQAEIQRIASSWKERTEAARAKYPDFEQVALLSPTQIPQGSFVDAFILEDEAGADVLYHYQQHPDDLRGLLAQPVLKQAKTLSLLSQRLMPSPRSETAPKTGAVPAPVVNVGSRPPTPVRTVPQRAGDEPPDGDHSIRDHEKYWSPAHRSA